MIQIADKIREIAENAERTIGYISREVVVLKAYFSKFSNYKIPRTKNDLELYVNAERSLLGNLSLLKSDMDRLGLKEIDKTVDSIKKHVEDIRRNFEYVYKQNQYVRDSRFPPLEESHKAIEAELALLMPIIEEKKKERSLIGRLKSFLGMRK